MPPKQVNYGKGRTLNEPNFAQSAFHAITSSDNRSVVTAIGMFAVRISTIPMAYAGRAAEAMKLRNRTQPGISPQTTADMMCVDWRNVPAQQLG